MQPTLLGVPILGGDPARFVLHHRADLLSMEHALHWTLATFSGATRPAAKQRIANGIDRNLQLVDRWLSALGRSVATGAGNAIEAKLRYERLFAQLVQAWSSAPSREAAWRPILDSVARQVREGGATGTALVLGPAALRVALELTNTFERVVAYDASAPRVLTYRYLAEGDLVIHEPTEMNVLTVDEIYRPVRLSLGVAGARPDRLAPALAAGDELPFVAQSFDAIVSVGARDATPLDRFLAACRRLLAPRGVLVKVGGLRYASGRLDEMWTGEEVRERVAASGLRVVADEVVEWVERSTPFVAHHIDAWSFAAVHGSDGP